MLTINLHTKEHRGAKALDVELPKISASITFYGHANCASLDLHASDCSAHDLTRIASMFLDAAAAAKAGQPIMVEPAS